MFGCFWQWIYLGQCLDSLVIKKGIFFKGISTVASCLKENSFI